MFESVGSKAYHGSNLRRAVLHDLLRGPHSALPLFMLSKIKSFQMPAESSSRTRTQLLTLQVVYLAVLGLIFVLEGVYPGPEFMFLLCVAVLVWRANTRGFLLDFFPFVLLLFSYELLRGVADNLSAAQIHVKQLVDLETAIFGRVPSAWLQAVITPTPFVIPVTVVSNVFYMSHFVVPFAAAFVVWRSKRETYWPFVLGLTALSYAGFITYLIYPAAPPWYAAKEGVLSGVVELTSYYLPVVMRLSPNPVAAMPSLHAAYPVFISLFCVHVFGRRAWMMFIFPVGVSFATVYLGHHYVIDLLAGYAYGIVFFVLTKLYLQRRKTHRVAEQVAVVLEERELQER
jgi:membrane-associated phospholipid phosphatase